MLGEQLRFLLGGSLEQAGQQREILALKRDAGFRPRFPQPFLGPPCDASAYNEQVLSKAPG